MGGKSPGKHSLQQVTEGPASGLSLQTNVFNRYYGYAGIAVGVALTRRPAAPGPG